MLELEAFNLLFLKKATYFAMPRVSFVAQQFQGNQQLYVIARFSDGPRSLAQTPSSVWASDLGLSENQCTISYSMNFFKKKELITKMQNKKR